MVKTILKRLLYSVSTFLLLTFFVFVLSNQMPGSAVDVLASETTLTDEAYAALERELGLDKPLLLRYAYWFGGVLKGDLGMSSRTKEPIAEIIGGRIAPTLILTLTALSVAILVSIPLGVMSAYKPYSAWDSLSSVLAFLTASSPNFFLCLCGIYIFSVKLKLLPTQGMYSAGMSGDFYDLLRHLVMPASIIALNQMGNLVKQTRGGVLEVLNEDYVKTARSKGISELRVVISHGLRNALIPIVTTISLSIPLMIGGSVVIERIFSWPGLGNLLIHSINHRDYNTIMGAAVVICIVVLVFNIILDILYAFLDPRINSER